MEFGEVVRRRRMVRRFDPDRPVASTALDAVLYAAQRAPSAGFSQGWDFVVLAEADDRQRFWDAARDSELPSDAPPDGWLAAKRLDRESPGANQKRSRPRFPLNGRSSPLLP